MPTPVGDLAGGGQLGTEDRSQRAQRLVFVGRHARPDPDDDVGPRQGLDVIVAAFAEDSDTTAGADGANLDRGVTRARSTPAAARQV